MKMLRWASMIALALTLCSAHEAGAFERPPPGLICDSCSDAAVQQKLRGQPETGNVQYVLDFDRGTIRQFVRANQNDWREIPVADAERHYFDLLKEFKKRNGGSLIYVQKVKIDGPANNLSLQYLDEPANQPAASAASQAGRSTPSTKPSP